MFTISTFSSPTYIASVCPAASDVARCSVLPRSVVIERSPLMCLSILFCIQPAFYWFPDYAHYAVCNDRVLYAFAFLNLDKAVSLEERYLYKCICPRFHVILHQKRKRCFSPFFQLLHAQQQMPFHSSILSFALRLLFMLWSVTSVNQNGSSKWSLPWSSKSRSRYQPQSSEEVGELD